MKQLADFTKILWIQHFWYLTYKTIFSPGGASPVPKREKIVQKINYRMDKVQL